MKEVSHKLNLIKIYDFCPAEDEVNRMGRQTTDQEKMSFQKIPEKRLIQNIQRISKTQEKENKQFN